MAVNQGAMQFGAAALRRCVALLGKRGEQRAMRLLTLAFPNLSDWREVVCDVRGKRLRFSCPNALTVWRAETLQSKEPETLEWIDGFAPSDVLWDIGANVGLYTVYAAVMRNVQVLAFEPSAANYALLNRNIEANRISDRVQALCLAFSDIDAVDFLNMTSTDFGNALSSFRETTDERGAALPISFRQGMIGMSIDLFVEHFKPPFPTRMKIDVDGIEDRIVAGAEKTLADPRLKSLSIELNSSHAAYIDPVIARFSGAGLQLAGKRHSAMFENTRFANHFNYRFERR